jgi:hypothetical protein
MDAEVTPEPERRRSPDTTLVAILIAIAVLVVVAIIVVLSRGTVAPLDPSSPEGVVQQYAQAVSDDRDAVEYLAPEAREQCDDFYYGTSDSARLTFVGTMVTGDVARVTVSITSTYGYSLFGSSQSSYEEVFTLTRDGDSWLITEAPYEFRTCDLNAGN